MDFNSFYVRGDGGNFVVDPLEPDDAVLGACRAGGVDAIVVTNRDHERFTARFVSEFNVPVIASVLDAPLLQIPVDRAVSDGDELFGWRVLMLEGVKTPGEFVLYRNELRAAISGDAFWGVPAGALRIMPDEKLADPIRATFSARRVRGLNLNALLVGDGAPVFRDASAVLGAAIDARTDATVNRINLDELHFRVDRTSPGPFGGSDAEVGLLLGAEKLGYRVVRLGKGEHFAPLHWHTAEEELFIVWDGTPMLRTPRGACALRRGDFIAFPTNAQGAHRVWNESDEPCTIIMIANTDKFDVCIYPDSRKLLVESLDVIVRSEPELAYFDGE